MILIVGGGLAGLAAAQKLKEAGYEDFYIFEAQDDIGGSLRSTHEHGVRIDLDAGLLYGGKKNPIYDWLSAFHGDDFTEFEMKVASVFATQDGKQAPYELINPIVNSALESKRLFSVGSKDLYSIKPLVNQFQQALVLSTNHGCSEDSSTYEKSIKLALKDWLMLHESILNTCVSADDLSNRTYREGNIKDGQNVIYSFFGWRKLIDKMVQSIGLDKIRPSSPVGSVEYSSKSVVVTLEYGMMFKCEHVIIATPIGTLKKSASKPPESSSIKIEMEPERQGMIDRIGFGPVTQIILKFEEQFLQESVGLLWTSDPSDVGLPPWTKHLTGFNVDLSFHNPGYLVAWVGRSGSLDVEKCTDSRIGEVCLEVIKKFLPDQIIPRLIATRVSRWSTNPYIAGANSYASVHSDGDADTSLWDPICVSDQENSHCASGRATGGTIPRVLFAGEATAGEARGTAHGAIMSGWREADRLLKFLSQPKQEATESKLN